jgi:hypothetical protein
MNCPKCSFQQDDGPECLRCGLVFSKRHATPPLHLDRGPGPITLIAGYAWRFYKVFRWVTLGVLILVLVLILHTSKPPVIPIPPDAAQLAEEKVDRFVSKANRGIGSSLEMDQPELNAWLHTNLALKKDGGSTSVAAQSAGSILELAKTATNGQSLDGTSLQQAKSTVRDIKVELQNDLVHVYVIFDLHGMDMSMELEGHLRTQDGYLRLDPTGGKFGSLPLFSSTLRAAADRLFSSPENKEKFKLPSYIQDLRIENGNMVILSR